jgi:hypothetical protein
VYNSPYAFSENKVINGVELEGREWLKAIGGLATGNPSDFATGLTVALSGLQEDAEGAMQADVRYSSGTSGQADKNLPGAVQDVINTADKGSDIAATFAPALDVANITLTFASMIPIGEAGLPAAMGGAAALDFSAEAFSSRISLADGFSMKAAPSMDDLTQQVTQTVLDLKADKQSPAAVVGAMAPDGSTSIATSGGQPSIIAPNLSIAADQVGGVGSVNAGNKVGCCAEFHAANDLMLKNPTLNATDLKFTDAMRAKGGGTKIVPACSNCATMFNIK